MTIRRREGGQGRGRSLPAGPVRQPGVRQFPLVTAQEISGVFAEASSEVWDLARIHEFVSTSVGEVLRRRKVPKRHVRAPDLEIAVPAIEAMRYCPFREELVSLLAAAMDARFSYRAHPSFVNILRQLTQDELRLLTVMPPSGEVIPLAHIYANAEDGRSWSIRRNLLPAELVGHCRSPEAIATYVDNLLRLQLVMVPSDIRIGEEAPYQDLFRQAANQDALREAYARGRPRVIKSALMLTDLGEHFCSVCLAGR